MLANRCTFIGKCVGEETIYMLANRCAFIGKCVGEETIYMLANKMCIYWEIHIFLCVSIARRKNNIKSANTQRSVNTRKYKKTKEKFLKTNAALLFSKIQKPTRVLSVFMPSVHIFYAILDLRSN
jgi:hypothetical protein